MYNEVDCMMFQWCNVVHFFLMCMYLSGHLKIEGAERGALKPKFWNEWMNEKHILGFKLCAEAEIFFQTPWYYLWTALVLSLQLSTWLDVSKILQLPAAQNFTFVKRDKKEFRREFCENPLAEPPILLAIGHWAFGYVEPWFNNTNKL